MSAREADSHGRRVGEARTAILTKLFLEGLQKARGAAGLTQAEVSSGSRSYVSRCGSGKRRVDVVELTEFARLYRKEARDFIG